ncbi:CRISPR-associated helicase Cas3' [Ruminococcus sp. 5_1_39BFAA]|uniref:CRISPR-associated helicase Cas3' n=1 Tax=Ruminococcus sp. 5_1_39BFAA TaxID=457412 RepID=UPI003566126C
MEYLAHINDEGEEQPLKDHLKNSAVLCGKFADGFGAYEWGYCCGLLHDLGKYSLKFQKRIRGSEEQVDHATAGARLCWDKKGMYQFLSYCIAGHHTGLPDTGGSSDTSGTMAARMKKNLENYQDYEKEIEIPVLKNPPFRPVKEENQDFFLSMLIRMLYSCLVDADYLDTELFMKGKSIRNGGEGIGILYEKLTAHISGWLNNQDLGTINGRRTEILKHCIEMGKAERGLFRLTVPTGGGKTIASLAFALRHAKEHDMERVIYVIPYTSIIEQNAKIFADILGKDNVLENHCNIDYGSSEELKPMQLAAENWDKPVIVTTNVQFFESLFSNKSSKCRKLHNIANSVIVFDEAQMLPNDYLKPCISAMEQLLRHYRSSIVLCTATQPALKNLLSQEIKITELCPRMEEQFSFFKRVSIINLNKISEENLIERLGTEDQALCILNTKKRAQKIYQSIEGEGVYHLSTSMYPAHRKTVLNKIRERLQKQERCVVISTSLVEAGVDLDFQTVYRQLAGADSVIQAAGRCNREGKRPYSECFTYIFKLDQKEYVPGQRLQTDITESLLEDNKNLENLDTIRLYFEMLYHLRGESLDKKEILEKFKKRNFQFARVGKEFRLIEENTKTIVIPKEEEAQKILEQLKTKGFTKELIRKIGPFCVNVYEEDFQKMFSAGMLGELSEDLKDYFVLKIPEKYTEEMGLDLNVEYGRAVIF